jgi:hypothetical protein
LKSAEERAVERAPSVNEGLGMGRHIALDKSEVVCGKPLPFSIFDPARNRLLAAKGQMVTERMRQALLRNGLVAVADDASPQSQREQAEQEAATALLQLKQQYARASAISRSGFRMSREERSECFSCHVIGIAERRNLILTAPVREDRSYVAISEGQTWLFRTFYATAAIRFTGIVEKLVFDPFPYFHVEVPALVEMRHIRKMQRVSVCMDATLDLAGPVNGLVLDLSTTGMRLALPAETPLHDAQHFTVQVRVQVLGEWHPLVLAASVVRCLGVADPMHPQMQFYGLGLQAQSERDRLLLHAYVQGCVIQELDGLSKVLAG